MSRNKTSILIRELRKEAGLTQEFVANKLGVSRAKYIMLEKGQTDFSLFEIKSLSKLYEVSPNEIVEGKRVTSEEEIATINTSCLRNKGLSIRETAPQINPDKLQNALLYILEKVGAKPNVGQTVLYKLLYFIDFDFYEQNGRSITGLHYIKNHFGPTPTKGFLGIVQEMQNAGTLEIVETSHFSHVQKKYLPVIRPDLSSFSAEEIKHIDAELERLADKSAKELSELSHKDMPWIAAQDGGCIDYQLSMYRTAETSVREFSDEL